MESDDDFDPYGSDVPSDLEHKKELLGVENQNAHLDFDRPGMERFHDNSLPESISLIFYRI